MQQTGVEGVQGSEVQARAGGDFDPPSGKAKEDEYESRSGSDNMDGAGSGDDQDADHPRKKKRYHRHTPQQIQELEAYSPILHILCTHPCLLQYLHLLQVDMYAA